MKPAKDQTTGRRRRKRCPYCRCLFVPDPRVTDRQWACRKPSCQIERRRETQRRYRAANPDEPAARRLRTALAAAKAGGPVAAPQGPPALVAQFPWAELEDEISPQMIVIMQFFAQLVIRVLRDEIRAQAGGVQPKTGEVAEGAEKDEMAANLDTSLERGPMAHEAPRRPLS